MRGWQMDRAALTSSSNDSIESLVVFTSGCFDLLHQGHIALLRRARQLGSRLIVGLNSDRSVRRLKGITRPIRNQQDRWETLNAIRYVNEVHLFEEDTPCNLVAKLRPMIIVKGPGYDEGNMPEASVIKLYGGQVVILDGPDVSTTSIVHRIISARQSGGA